MKTYTLTEGGLVDLDRADASLLEVDDLITESQSELPGLELTRDIRTREGPVEDCDRPVSSKSRRLAMDALFASRAAVTFAS